MAARSMAMILAGVLCMAGCQPNGDREPDSPGYPTAREGGGWTGGGDPGPRRGEEAGRDIREVERERRER